MMGGMDSRVYQQVGKRLRGARIAAGLTQKDVALACMVSRQTVSAWENGALLSTRQFYDLCLRYGVSADYLLFGVRTIPASGGKMLKEIFREIEEAGDAPPSAWPFV